MKTKFFRFLVAQFMYSHHITKESYTFVPIQDFSKPWTDEELYAKYGLTADEIAFIEQMIRPMPATGEQEAPPAEDEEE
jgi:site-specific DNA-methyltransferase (adenine-specific)